MGLRMQVKNMKDKLSSVIRHLSKTKGVFTPVVRLIMDDLLLICILPLVQFIITQAKFQ